MTGWGLLLRFVFVAGVALIVVASLVYLHDRGVL